MLREDSSPAQVVGWFTRFDIRVISHEAIYRPIWQDKKAGGTHHVHLRRANTRIRKRYGHYDSSGRLDGKRHVSTRLAGATDRSRIGHWEVDTVLGDGKAGARKRSAISSTAARKSYSSARRNSCRVSLTASSILVSSARRILRGS